ncbi:acyl--CoA ligase [Pseudomonas sp. TH05]|uniref:class I adenylate-forming enzyme family protein n=1 Tax=unclassified Pseudomonas TaxID=196821 RepID=UPI0003551952|nr:MULTISPECIES: class I adenylate-forming enzyme family protein [unclassified Pseudomonas]EPL10678.1 peptide arylation protein [Pseudomonas sp. CF161]MBK5540448.1 acyl--CoA ligase [Pseudomonas sp. TH07]MBK5555863.1 acyl--CoA ligase [Pseudomonas sp. TH05]
MNNAGIIDLVPADVRRVWESDGTYPNRSVYQLFREHALREPHKPAVLCAEGTLSYGELHDAALRMAASLRASGIVAGDVVAYQLTNSWRSCAIDLAAAALGAVVAPFPPGRGSLDIQALVRRCDARAVIVPAEYAGIDLCQVIEALRPTLLSLRVLIVEGEARAGWLSLESMLKAEPLSDAQLPTVCANSPVRLLVSSGTESEPKLVAYSHNALVGGRGRFLQRIHPEGATFRGLYLVPLGSSFGSTATFGSLSWLGGSIALLSQFDVGAAIEAIEQLRPTHILGVPTMLQRIAADARLAEVDKSSLLGLICGGSLIDEVTVRRCVEAFGCGFISLYGSADGVNCHNTLDDALDVVFYSVGRPNPAVCAIKIFDEHGQELPQGSIGEIKARGPLSPMQYVNAPELDAQYRDAEGWVNTGDLGYIDADGYLILSGRKKDIIIRGGANISPVQIETLATGHPDVVSVACVPVPDPDLGQRVCICVTLRDGAPRFSLTELTDYLREQGLEVNKLPEYLRFYRQLPLTPAGKIDKKSLAAEVAFLESGAGIAC